MERFKRKRGHKYIKQDANGNSNVESHTKQKDQLKREETISRGFLFFVRE
jgi:hypothetical protein